jgi:hypothetical protein
VKLGLKGGLAYGLVQDAASYLSGNRLFYVDYLKRAFGTPSLAEKQDEI